MLIYRGAATQHPRASTSAPAISPRYWIPRTSVSCTGVNEIPSLLAPFPAAAFLHRGAAPSFGQRDDVVTVDKQGDEDAAVVATSSEPLDACSFPTEPPANGSWSRGMAFFVSALLAFVGSVAVMFVVSQLLQTRELAADEPMMTAVAHQPLVQKPSSGRAYDEDAAAAVHRSFTAPPRATNRSRTVGNDEHLPEAATTTIRGRTVFRGRNRRGSNKPRATDPVSTTAVDTSAGTETTAWLD